MADVKQIVIKSDGLQKEFGSDDVLLYPKASAAPTENPSAGSSFLYLLEDGFYEKTSTGAIRPLTSDHAGKYVDLLTNQTSIGGNKTFNNKVYINDSLSLGTSASGERLHIADGNIFLDGGGETAFKTRRLTTFNNTHVSSPFVNPTFQIGRIIQGGDGAPQFRWMYNDDVVGETVVMELDSEGIMSSVRQERGSHFEGHIANEANPFFRINSFPDIRLEFGQGATFATDVSISRPSANVLSFNRGSGGSEISSMKIDASGNVGVGLNPLYRIHSSGDIKADWNLRAGDSVYTSGVKLGWDTIEQYGADIDGASIAINYNGFNGGATRFRNLGVFDGKNGIVWDVVGSTKKTQFYGDVGTQQNFIAAGTVSALGGNSTQWNTSFGWGNHVGLYSALGHTHTNSVSTAQALDINGYNFELFSNDQGVSKEITLRFHHGNRFYNSIRATPNNFKFTGGNDGTVIGITAGEGRFTNIGVTNIITNRLARFDGTVLSSSIITDDGTNVGIGTTTPFTVGGSAKLSLYTSTSNEPFTFGNSNADALYFRRYGVGSYQIQTSTGGNDGNLSLQSYGGNVGIGTTNPSAKLDVEGDISYAPVSAIYPRRKSVPDWYLGRFNGGNTIDNAFGASGTFRIGTHVAGTFTSNIELSSTGAATFSSSVTTTLLNSSSGINLTNSNQGIGFNRRVVDGLIYNETQGAFQLQHVDKRLQFQTYNGATGFEFKGDGVFDSSVTAPTFYGVLNDGYIQYSAAQINRLAGGYVELQYSSLGGVQMFGSTPANSIKFETNGSANFSSNVTAPTFIGALSGNATTANYAISSTRLYATGGGYGIGDVNPYYMAMTYNGAQNRWRLAVTPGTPADVEVNYADKTAIANIAENLTSTQGNWADKGVINAVVGQLAWKNYGNNHVIFDASQSTSPSGTGIDSSNSQNAWIPQYPTLMGWNGANTYGVRVDRSRLSDSALSVNWNSVDAKPTTIEGYGITNTVVKRSVSPFDYANSQINHYWNKIGRINQPYSTITFNVLSTDNTDAYATTTTTNISISRSGVGSIRITNLPLARESSANSAEVWCSIDSNFDIWVKSNVTWAPFLKVIIQDNSGCTVYDESAITRQLVEPSSFIVAMNETAVVNSSLQYIVNPTVIGISTSGASNIGIGIKTATAKLHVNGTFKVSGVVTFDSSITSGTNYTNGDIYTTEGLRFNNGALNATDKKLYSPEDGVLEWMTHTGAANKGFAISHQGTKGIYLNLAGNSYLNGGNVGIGITTPSAKLDVAGTFNATGTATFSSSVSVGGQLNLGPQKIYFDQSGVRSWGIQASGGNLNINSGDNGGNVALTTNLTSTGAATFGSSVTTTGTYTDGYCSLRNVLDNDADGNPWYGIGKKKAGEVTVNGWEGLRLKTSGGNMFMVSSGAATFSSSVTVQGKLIVNNLSSDDGIIENNSGGYFHIGGWGVGRTDATAVLVNTAFMADTAGYATAAGTATKVLDGVVSFRNNDGWGRVTTASGYIDIGPANSSHAHIYTDMPTFYFNKDLLVNGQTVIHSGSIGSQSVNYANSAGTVTNDANYRSLRASNYIDITVGGDANTYYPVTIGGYSEFGFHRYSISRGYGWTAPDTWNTASHKGGLTFSFEWSGDVGWGGNDKTIRVIQFQENYSTMVAGMGLPVTGGVLVWLRGGTATYRIHTEAGTQTSAIVHLGGFTSGDNAVFSARTDVSQVQAEIYGRFPIRGNSDGSGLTGNASAFTVGNSTYANTAGNTNSISNAVGLGYRWTGINHFNGQGDTGSASNPSLQAYSDNGSGAYMSFHRSGAYALNMGLDSDNVFRIGGWSAAANRLQMDMSGNLTMAGNVTATAFYGPSDMRLKTLVDKVHTSSVSNIEEISYLWKDKSKGEVIQVGYSAQEVQKVMPSAVNTDADGMLSVNYIQVLVAKVAELEKRLKQLEYGI